MTTKRCATPFCRNMTGAVVPRYDNLPAEPFKWRDGNGVFHPVAGMETRHLFFTLRMIWNNTMPAMCRLPGNLYSFGPFYTKKYMLDAVAAITAELANRTDMAPDWLSQLQQLVDWLATPQLTVSTRY